MRTFLALCAAIILLTACGEDHAIDGTTAPDTVGATLAVVPPEDRDEMDDTNDGTTARVAPTEPHVGRVLPIEFSPDQLDSLTFRLTHHYSENFNFTVHADSLVLLPAEGETAMDTAVVRKGDLLVVAQVKRISLTPSPLPVGAGPRPRPNGRGLSPVGSVGEELTPDSFAIKVARDQWTMGWIGESELLAGVVPDDTLSEIIYLTHPWLLPLLAILAALLVWIAARLRLPRLYPTLLLICTLLLIALGAYVRHVVPEFWREFYFHPTLNPLILPLPLACYVATAWLTVICAVAVGIDWYGHHREPQEP